MNDLYYQGNLFICIDRYTDIQKPSDTIPHVVLAIDRGENKLENKEIAEVSMMIPNVKNFCSITILGNKGTILTKLQLAQNISVC